MSHSQIASRPAACPPRVPACRRPLAASAVAALVLVGASDTARGATCITPTATCTEWIGLGPSAERSRVYSSYPLTMRNDQITRALIVVHGSGRDADGFFRTGVSAALLAGALQDTVVLSPRFASHSGPCRDELEPGEANWDCGEGRSGGWRSGAPAISSPRLTSFDLMDRLLAQLATRDAFPNLRVITVAGFSAGGQYVHRYQMVNRVHDTLGIRITYVVASPSSYAYVDASRPGRGGARSGTPSSSGGFGAFASASTCPTYDQWPYGLVGRTGPLSRLGVEQLRSQLVGRPVTYVVGDQESPQTPALDRACAAMAQGSSRLTRAQAYFKYVTERLGARHTLIVVPQCGHSGRCVLTSDRVLRALFPATD